MTTGTMDLDRAATAEAANKSKALKRLDIQGLRAVAVLAVIADHLFDWPSGGFVGVDVFFVISGFLITGMLLHEHDRTGRISFVEFYRRRAKRILPASVTVLAATVLASWLLVGWSRTSDTFHDALWALGFAGNWNFYGNGTDYFAAGQTPSPLQHYWSLGVEEQFYFVWPWLMLLIFVVMGSRGRSPLASRRVAGTVIGAITIASFAFAVAQTHSNPTGAYFSSFTRAWELGLGAVLAITATFWKRVIPPAVGVALSWLGIVAIAVSLFVVPASPGFPAPWAALPVLAAGVVILGGGSVTNPRSMRLLTNRPAVRIGDLSYSLYLWHFPVVILLLAVYPEDSAAYYVWGIVLIAALSVAGYYLIEEPLHTSKWSLTSDNRSSGSGASGGARALAVLGIVAIALCWKAVTPVDPPAGSGTLPAAATTASGSTTDQTACLGAGALLNPADCTGSDAYGTDTYPLIDNLANDDSAAYACFSNVGDPMKTCNYGSTAPDALKVAMVGDSHAASLLGGITSIAGDLDWNLDSYVGAGCVWTASVTQDCPGMKDIQQSLLDGGYDLVITSAYRGSGGTDKSAEAQDMAAAWAPVAATGARIVALADVPNVGDEVQCLFRVGFDIANNDCTVSARDAYEITDPQQAAVSEVTGAKYVDTRPYFCPGQSCALAIGNVFVYRDEISHVSDTYSATVAPYLAKAIQAAAS